MAPCRVYELQTSFPTVSHRRSILFLKRNSAILRLILYITAEAVVAAVAVARKTRSACYCIGSLRFRQCADLEAAMRWGDDSLRYVVLELANQRKLYGIERWRKRA